MIPALAEAVKNISSAAGKTDKGFMECIVYSRAAAPEFQCRCFFFTFIIPQQGFTPYTESSILSII